MQVGWRSLVIGAAADKAAHRSITISYLHPSSSLHQRPKASVTSDAVLITTCSCLDCLRVALLPPNPQSLMSCRLLLILHIPISVLRWSSEFTYSYFGKPAHKEDVMRHMRRSLAALLYLHIAVVVMQVAFVWWEPRSEECWINPVNPGERGCRVKSFTVWICLPG